MKFTVLGSGSSGNAVLICAGETRVLVDAGMSAKELVRRLALVGCDAATLDGIIITHEHGDHAGGLRVLLKSLSCPVYISGETRDAYIGDHESTAKDEPRKRADVLRDRTEEISSSRDFRIGEIDFHPFTIPHDAADNFGFTARHDGICLATLMDFGHITTLINERLRGCAAVVLVAQHVVLTHLSQRANNPYLAKLSAEIALQERGSLFATTTRITLSFPKELTAWIEL